MNIEHPTSNFEWKKMKKQKNKLGASPQPVESVKVVRLEWWNDGFERILSI